VPARPRHAVIQPVATQPVRLVLAGPAGQAHVLPWITDSVFLFQREELLTALTARGVKIGVPTSVRKPDREATRIYPPPQAPRLQLS